MNRFGGKNEFSKTGRNFPGPGAYNIKASISLKERGKSFGKDAKGKGDSTERHLRSVPGPGQYDNPANALKTSAPKFGKFKRNYNFSIWN